MLTGTYRMQRYEHTPQVHASFKYDDEIHWVPLPHIVRHSPDGFSMGYAGSGPSDLALSILTHWMADDPKPETYHQFKMDFLVKVGEKSLVITTEEVRTWYNDYRAQRGDPRICGKLSRQYSGPCALAPHHDENPCYGWVDISI